MSVVWDNIKLFAKEVIWDTVSNIRLTDVIDILLLALILFYLYRFIRDRRAGKLMIGLCLIVVLVIISTAFNMQALKYVFDNFYQVGIIAIIIVFQPEMRAALEKVGGTTLGLKNIATESRELATMNAAIDGISSAASDLSRDKVGALIVIERTTKLGEYIKSGVVVDAAISPHILRNIFFNKAPLHDGAVIIRNQRVYAAGCFLPLSTNTDINQDLGTRHRAAIGMTECSDAIVVVISEETGTISISVDGNLKRNYNYTTLKQELNTLLAPQGQHEAGKGKKSKEKKVGKRQS